MKFTVKKKDEFLKQLEIDGNVSRSSAAIGVSTRTVYNHREKSAKFADEWDAALRIGDSALIDEAKRRALAGSDTLLIFMIKGRHPEFRDKFALDVPADSKFSLKINTGHSKPTPAASPTNTAARGESAGAAPPKKKRGRPRKVKP